MIDTSRTASRRFAVLIFGALTVLAVTVIACKVHDKNEGASSQPAGSPVNGSPSPAAVPASQARSVSPPPKYRVFKQSSVDPTSVVVAEGTTDEQLRSLLWFFREKVRSHDFKSIGLSVPTSTNFGEKNWGSGQIEIFKGTKCAGENYGTKGGGPCGEGDHDAAYYQWGVDAQADRDEAGLVASDGKLTVVFSYKDGWTLPPDVQAKLQAEQIQQKAAEDQEAEKNKTEEDLFAAKLQERVRGLGFHMKVFRGGEPDQLMVDSELFKDDSGRVEFLSSVLPNWRRDLCRAGYRTINLSSGTFSLGDNYSIGCR